MATTFPMANPWVDGDGLNAAKMLSRVTTPINDLAALTATDTGWLTTALTPATGSTITSQNVRQFGPLLVISFTLQLGAAINIGADGNTTNTALAVLDPAYRPSAAVNQCLVGGPTGPMTSWIVKSDGLVTLCAASGGATMAAGTALSGGGVILL